MYYIIRVHKYGTLHIDSIPCLISPDYLQVDSNQIMQSQDATNEMLNFNVLMITR